MMSGWSSAVSAMASTRSTSAGPSYMTLDQYNVQRTYPFQDGGLTLGCSRRDSRRRCLGFSTGLTARGTKDEYQDASSYMFRSETFGRRK